jgi:hypothetical protein
MFLYDHIHLEKDFFGAFEMKFQSLVNHFSLIQKRVWVKSRLHIDFIVYKAVMAYELLLIGDGQINTFANQFLFVLPHSCRILFVPPGFSYLS